MDDRQQMHSVSHPSDDGPRSKVNLLQKMSEVISLREKVAQAELAQLGNGDEGSSARATSADEKYQRR
jgi:hypothetical protein